MVLRLLGNAFVSQKIESSHLYSYHPCKTPPCRKKGNCAQRCVIKGIYLNNISYIAPVPKPNHSQLTWLATVFPVIETNPLSVDTLWLQPHYQIEEIFIGHCRTTWYWWKIASLVINTSGLLLAFLSFQIMRFNQNKIWWVLSWETNKTSCQIHILSCYQF